MAVFDCIYRKFQFYPRVKRLLLGMKNWRECLWGCFYFLLFLIRKISRQHVCRKVLMVEGQPWHGEILPGYVHYFQELGYEVDLLVRYKNFKDSPFVRMKEKPKIYCLTIGMMLRILRSSKIAEYHIVFFTSDLMYLEELSFWGRFVELAGLQNLQKVFWVEHDLQKCYDLIKNNTNLNWEHYFSHVFALTGISFQGYLIPELNPSYFGKAEIARSWKEEKILLVIGRISSQVRDFNTFLRMIREMEKDYSFRILVIGKMDDPDIIQQFPQNVQYLGYLDFGNLYKILDKAYFLLPLLSKDVLSHRHYLETCTSGSRQLSLGFHLPMIIQKDFARHYGFSEKNAICYDREEDMMDAFKRAMTMSDQQYNNLRSSLQQEQKQIYHCSLQNLKQRLGD